MCHAGEERAHQAWNRIHLDVPAEDKAQFVILVSKAFWMVWNDGSAERISFKKRAWRCRKEPAEALDCP